MKKVLLTTLFIWITIAGYSQGIGVNNSTPDPSALLDLTDPVRGLLVPRVALTSRIVAAPITAPATSLMVYNSATAGVFPNNVTPGYYYWNGAAWNRFRDTGTNDSWLTIGNAGTVATTNFIGTTDAVDFVMRTTGTERMRILSTGNVGIGTAVPVSKLVVTGTGSTNASSSLNIRNSVLASMLFVRDDIAVGINNAAPNASAVLDISATAKGVLIPRLTSAQRLAIVAPATGLLVFETVTNQFMYFDGTIWRPLLGDGTGWETTGNTGTIATTNFAGTTDLVDFVFRTNNVNRARIKANGQVGINVTNPFAQLDVFSFSGADTIVFRARNNGALGTICQIGSIEYFKDFSNTTDFNNGVNSAQFSINLSNNGTRDLQLAFDDAGKPGTSTWTVISDERLKSDIKPFKDGLETLTKIKPVYYKYNGKASTPKDEYFVGVIAQELKEATPYMVSTFEYTPNPRDLDTRETYFDVNNGALTYILVNAVKELDEKFEKLKNVSKNVTDFGQSTITGRETFIPFSEDFAAAISGSSIPVVTISPVNALVSVFVKEVSASGFTVVATDDVSNLSVNWIAAGKVASENLRTSKTYTETERNELLNKVVRKPSVIRTTEEDREMEKRKLEQEAQQE
ncbi:MAG: tail fiber domain-containing protein [Bacteroidia bacterium]|nr:tail fiber domain-containing protein [Bacteroidia bacterium]